MDLSGNLCLVTGAISGLGLATARGLAVRGATLLVACRDPVRGAAARDAVSRETGNAAVHLGVVDISSLVSVSDFVARLDEVFGVEVSRLDLVVHNAGVLPDHREISSGSTGAWRPPTFCPSPENVLRSVSVSGTSARDL